MTPVIAYSTAVLAVIAAGLAFRRRRRVHIPLMLSAFVLDVASVLYLQVQRQAVQTAVGKPTTMLMIHVSLAIGTILLYLIVIPLGWRLAVTGKGRPQHRRAAVLFLLFRVGTWVTAFFATPG
ncbi:MAG: hypothetical protein HYY18_15605 [Planctomycetes bacterium]|nr:hypothetical protein [Planctomycetota bacterium]